MADFGLERLVLRDISRDHQKANYYLARLLPLRLLLSLDKKPNVKGLI